MRRRDEVFTTSKPTFLVLFALLSFVVSCSVTPKPTTQMIFASASIKAAAYVNAERLAPDEYRRAENAFWQAKKYFMLKEFQLAEKYAKHTQRLAEEAEIKAEIKAMTTNSF